MAETATPRMMSAATNLNLLLVESETYVRWTDALASLDISKNENILYLTGISHNMELSLCFQLGQKRRGNGYKEQKLRHKEIIFYPVLTLPFLKPECKF